jgi:uncharacterized protein (TIGR02145 family)
MRTNRSFLIVTVLALAITFTFNACSGDEGGGNTPPDYQQEHCEGLSSALPGSTCCQYNSSFNGCNTKPNITYGTLSDTRDGKSYRTVTIGTQLWMADNLNYNASGSKCYGEDGKACYSYNFSGITLSNESVQANCAKYGRLYDWETAMSACPSGWHVPTHAEWNVLYSYAEENISNCEEYVNYGSCPTSGKHLKSLNGWNCNSGNGLNSYGFSALPGGERSYESGDFWSAGEGGFWWSSTENSNLSAFNRKMQCGLERADWSSNRKANMYSVRCIYGEFPASCGKEGYVPYTGRFCQDVTNKELDMCGYWKYTADQICDENYNVKAKCGDVWYDVHSNDNLNCVDGIVKRSCGLNVWYDPENEFCPSYGVVKELCNGEWYWSYQMCENGVIKYKCGTISYDPKKQFCQNDTELKDYCGGKDYTADQICENDVVKGKCGTVWYNTESEFCQSGTNIVMPFCGEYKDYKYSSLIFCFDNTLYDYFSYSKCGDDGVYAKATQFCQSGTNKVLPLCNRNTYTSSQFCQSGTNVVLSLCGGTETYTSSQFCVGNAVYDNTTHGKCNESAYEKATEFCQSGTNAILSLCGGTTTYASDQFCQSGTNAILPLCGGKTYTASQFCDVRYSYYDAVAYKWVKIGEQIWMADNLNYNASGSKCFNNDPANCDKYGRLYNWNTAINVCPFGWHLPNDDEWNTLMTTVGGISTANYKLQAIGVSNNSTDEFGFSALWGGNGNPDGSFSSIYNGSPIAGYWWSNTQLDANRAWYWESSTSWVFFYYSYDTKDMYNSIRCLKDD